MKRAGLLALAVSLGAVVWLSGRQEPLSVPPARNALSSADLPTRTSLPNLDSTLSRLLDVRRTEGEAVAAAFASRRGLKPADGTIRVVFETRASGPRGHEFQAQADTLADAISVRGGKVQARFRNLIQAVIPEQDLIVWAGDPRIARVRAPRRPFLHRSTSEGVALTGADSWASLPSFHTAPAKIAILDLGFSGYEALLGTDLPETVETRSFRSDSDLEAGEPHGAACAEIVHDMAPQALITLSNFDTDVEQYQALQWFADEGVDVISYSVGWYNAGAGDGTGPICAAVDYAVDQGMEWVNSAGNSADAHWDGEFVDSDSDGFHEFAEGDEILSFNVPAGETVGAFLNWKDWGFWNGFDYSGTNQDYDMILWLWNGSAWEVMDSAMAVQDGGDWPTEELYGYSVGRNAVWGVSIVRYRADRNIHLELFTLGNSNAIEHNVPSRSLTTPADSARAWTAGASDALGDFYHFYSSQGPTWDGRIKPDFAAPSGVSTTSYGVRGFYGTSAAAPHLAGALGLFRGGTRYRSDQIRAILGSRALDLGAPGPDNLFGSGRLNLKKK